jgi:hypothetical protein
VGNEVELLNGVVLDVSVDHFGVLVELNVLFLDVSAPEVKSGEIYLVVLGLNQTNYVVRTLFTYFAILILIEAM